MTRSVLRLLTTVGTALLVLLLLTTPAQAAPPNIPSESAARSQLASLTVSGVGSMTGYSRDRFPHWNYIGNGCDVRDEVLRRDGTNITVGANCTISGRWYSPYDNVTLYSPSDVQIDHIVPLAEAWRMGASSWTQSRRQSFANDLNGPALLAVSGSSNGAKGDQPPNYWRPSNTAYWCTYARMWVGTKYRWGLRVTSGERSALYSMLDRC